MLPASAAPWSVHAQRRQNGEWTVSLVHEASNGLVFETKDTDAAGAIRSVGNCLRDSVEVQRVARAPKLNHLEAVAGVRTLVQCFGWSRVEVGAVAGLLTDLAALSAEEAEWIKSSFGDDKPPPRATRMM
jgi:hypothetical protein